MDAYQLEKLVWDDGDFAVMGWHDATIWSMLPDPAAYEFSLDLDYIFHWADPGVGETHYKFWVAPVTMVFENADTINIDIESPQGIIEIADLFREEPELTPNGILTEYTYRFECQEGEVSLRSTGFRMFVRRAPELRRHQRFSLAERGGVGFQRGHGAA